MVQGTNTRKSEWEVFFDLMIPSSVVFPVEYGFVPQTCYDDQDPLDIMVLSYERRQIGTNQQKFREIR